MVCADCLVTLGGNIGLAAAGSGSSSHTFQISDSVSTRHCRTKDIYIVTMYYTSLPPLLVVLLAAVSDVLAEVASIGTCPDVRGGVDIILQFQFGLIVSRSPWLIVCCHLNHLIRTLIG